MWKYILIGLGVVVLELILVILFSSWYNIGSGGNLSGIIVCVGGFLAFEMVICTGVIISTINTNKNKQGNFEL